MRKKAKITVTFKYEVDLDPLWYEPESTPEEMLKQEIENIRENTIECVATAESDIVVVTGEIVVD